MMHTRVALVGVFCAVAAACTSVRPIHPTTYLEVNAPPVVWVTYNDNKVVPLNEAEVRRDTLRGTLDGAHVKIPLADVQTVRAKVHDGGKTALLVGTVGVAALSALYVGLISQSGSSNGGGEGVYCGVDKRGRNELYC
jgi:hypothetical protein